MAIMAARNILQSDTIVEPVILVAGAGVRRTS